VLSSNEVDLLRYST